MKKEILNIDYLKNEAKLIHYFGLGFIQVKLNDSERVHFYTKELPAIVNLEDVHNHRYSFTSYVLSGEFTQELFDIADGDTHTLRDESCREGVDSNNKEKLCTLRFAGKHTYVKGSNYTVDKNVYHRVYSDNAITYLVREKPSKQFAQVIREKEAPLICPFSKKVPEEELWNIVEKILKTTTQNTS